MDSSKEILFTFGKHSISANKNLTGIKIDYSEEQLLLSFLYELNNYLETDEHLRRNIMDIDYYNNYIKENYLSKKVPLAKISTYEISKHPTPGYMFIRNRYIGNINGRGQISVSIELICEVIKRYPNGVITKSNNIEREGN